MSDSSDTMLDTAKNPPLCAHCGQRPGTERWVGEGGSLAFIHGFYEYWCPICMLEAQIAYANERARALPEMEQRLAALKAAEKESS